MYKVSIIIINYNSSRYTLECIQSIYKNTDCDFSFHIILIDNNSNNEDFLLLEEGIKIYKNIKLLRSKVNLGFSGGNMLGAKYSDSEYLYFLNNDCVLLNDNLSLLYNFMRSEKRAGLCTGQMFNTDKSFHHSFNYFPCLKLKLFGSGPLRFLSPSKYPSRKIHYKTPLKVPFITGAAMFIDSNIFRNLGGFDTNFFLYCEEEDICYRINSIGYDPYLVPEARFIHHMGKSTKRNFSFERENYISLLYFFRKHYTHTEYFLLKILYFLKNIKKFYRSKEYVHLAFFILKGSSMKYSLRYQQHTQNSLQ